jgi:chromosome segregation ATPase
MLSVNKLEKVIELEEQLRGEYQSQLDAKTAELASAVEKQASLQAIVDTQLATIERQLQTITELSDKSTDSQRVEQLNRELSNRADNLQAEVTELKKRTKTLQKDLAEERAENKTLKQYDPERMRKNLDSSKKKLAEKTKANAVLQKSLSQTKSDSAEHQAKIKELEASLEELQENLETDEEEVAAA